MTTKGVCTGHTFVTETMIVETAAMREAVCQVCVGDPGGGKCVHAGGQAGMCVCVCVPTCTV